MAVELVELVELLRANLNVPGTARPMFNFDDEAPWVNALAAGFWMAKNRGRAVSLWTNYRVNVDADQIVNIVDASIELDPEDQYIVVLQAAMTAIETLLLSLPTHIKNVAGPTSTELERSSNVLRQLLLDKRQELEDSLKATTGGSTVRAYIVDAIITRSYGGIFVN